MTEIKLPDMLLGGDIYSGGKTLTLNRGIGSAALCDPNEVVGVVWTIADRGPNLDCEGIDELTGFGSRRVGLLRFAAFMNRTAAPHITFSQLGAPRLPNSSQRDFASQDKTQHSGLVPRHESRGRGQNSVLALHTTKRAN